MTSIVAEMTGYPADLLEPDLDLEADLGVDTVKQAEVFAAVRGHYHLERDENLKLRDFPTLRHVAGWVRQRAGLAAPATASAPAVACHGRAERSAPAPRPAGAGRGARRSPRDRRAAAAPADAVAAPGRVELPADRRAACRRPGGGDGRRGRRRQGPDEAAHQGRGQGARVAAGHGHRRPAGQPGPVAAGRADRRRVLAAGAGRRRRPRRARCGRVARGLAPSREVAVRHDAPALRREPVPGGGDPAGRLPRLRRGRRDQPARRRGGRLHQVVPQGASRSAGQGGRRGRQGSRPPRSPSS